MFGKKIVISDPVQITKWLHFIFYFQVGWKGEGWFEGDSTWLIHYKKNTKNTDSHPAVLLNRNFFNPIFNTKVVLRAAPFFAVSTVLHVIISKQDYYFRKILIDMHIYFRLKGNILALIHLRVLLLNKYEISSISEYPVWKRHGEIFWNFGR
jgi:hypothetical protein